MKGHKYSRRRSVIAEAELSSAHPEDLAQALTQIRRAAGLTQQHVAEAMQTTQSSIAKLERGQTLPSTRTLHRFAAATHHAIQIRFLHEPDHLQREKVSHTMTDTREKFSGVPALLPSRRQFLSGAMGLAGLLGTGKIHRVTAQETTAAATAVDSYVWTPPKWDPEPALFTFVDRNDQSIVVETVDGQIELPADPQRIVSLAWEYIPLFDLGVVEKVVGVAYGVRYGHQFWNAGDRTQDMHAALDNVTRIPDPWELDIEQVIELNPDLILTSVDWPADTSVLSQTAPTVRSATLSSSAPRSAVRDYGALFDRSDLAEEVIQQHDERMQKARAAIDPVMRGKKGGTICIMGGELIYAIPSYYIVDDQVFSYSDGAYQLHRELNITPSSFVENLADDGDRASFGIELSMEHMGSIDADHLFVYDYDNSFDAFLSNPLLQQTTAGRLGQIYLYDGFGYGLGLGGVQAAVLDIVKHLTGEPFE